MSAQFQNPLIEVKKGTPIYRGALVHQVYPSGASTLCGMKLQDTEAERATRDTKIECRSCGEKARK